MYTVFGIFMPRSEFKVLFDQYPRIYKIVKDVVLLKLKDSILKLVTNSVPRLTLITRVRNE